MGSEGFRGIPANWRLHAQRYRLEGFRNADGEVGLQQRPLYPPISPPENPQVSEPVSDNATKAA